MKALTTILATIAFVALGCGGAQPNASTTKANVDPQVPSNLSASIDASDEKAIETYLTSLIEAYEGVTAGAPAPAEDRDLLVLFNANNAKDCALSVDGAKLSCETVYVLGRWNGVVDTEFAVTKGRAVTLTKAEFTGSF